MLAFNNSNNFVGLLHLQATQCMTNSNFHRVCLLPACHGLGRVQRSLASCQPSLSSLHSPLHHRCKDRDHWERQQENKSCPIFDIFIFTTIIFSDSSGRLSAMVRKKKEPKRWSISQRFFSQLEKKGGGSDQKHQIDLEMWGYSPQQYLEFAKKWTLLLEGIWRVHLGHIWMPSLFKVGQLQYIWQSRKARILVLQKIKCQLGC